MAKGDLTIITKSGAVTARGVQWADAKREVDAAQAAGRDVVINTGRGSRSIPVRDIINYIFVEDER
jgi:hypothetical protein